MNRYAFISHHRGHSKAFPSIVGAILFWLLAAHAHAEGLINIKPYLAGTATYDDNLFRLAGHSQAGSDWIRHIQAGVSADANISRQRVRLELGIDDSHFDRNSFLDNTGHSGKLAWYWQLGHKLSGEFSASDSVAMSGFSEIHNPVLNLRTSRRYVARANLDVTSNWRLYLQQDTTEQQNSLASYRGTDREDAAKEGGVQFSSTAGNMLTMSFRETESRYAHRDSFSSFFFGNTNDQREIATDLLWLATGKIRVHGRLTNVTRQYQELAQRNFNGYNKRLDVNWAVADKGSLTLSTWEEISGVDDLGATYVQSDGASISPVWQATDKLSVFGQLLYERRSYLGDPGVILGSVSRRENEVRLAGVTLSYLPHPKLRMELAYQGERRTDSVASAGYMDNSLTASLRVSF